MYEKRFGLHRKPFQTVLNDSDFFQSEAFAELSPTVLHALQSDQGVAVLTGPGGVGKSSTLEFFRRSLSGTSQSVLLRGGSARTPDELLHSLHRLLLKTAGDPEAAASNIVRRWDVVERLQRVTEFWGPLSILIDDAHLMAAETFAELRSLLEEEISGQKIVRLLISGPLVLEEVLAQPTMSDFAQKIRVQAFLQPLRTAESVTYLKQQLSNSGATASDIFENKAVEKIVAAADGVPRCLNLLGDECLMVCNEIETDKVTVDVVDRALRRLQHLPVTWNAAPTAADDIDDETDGSIENECANNSTIEIGSSVESGSSGVIEIGGESPSSQNVSASATGDASATDLGMDTAGVIEIGGATEPPTTVDSNSEGVECHSDAIAFSQIEPEVDEPESYDVGDVEFESADLEQGVAYTAHADDSTSADFSANTDDAWVEVDPSPETEVTDAEFFDDVDHAEEPAADLAHHLLLSSSQEISPVVTADASTEEVNLASAELVDFGEYSRWQPAGSWAAFDLSISKNVTVSTVEHADKDVAEVSPTIRIASADVSEENDAALDDSVALNEPEVEFLAAQDANRIPVFDRYTWCELGRSVSPTHRQRRSLGSEETPVAEWPPKLKNIVPFAPIAVEDIGNDSDGLIHAGDDSVERDVAAVEPRTPDAVQAPTASSPNPYDSLPQLPEPDPELTIDQIQELLHTEIFEVADDRSSSEAAEGEDELLELLPEVPLSFLDSEPGPNRHPELDTLTDVVSLPVYTGPDDLHELSDDLRNPAVSQRQSDEHSPDMIAVNSYESADDHLTAVNEFEATDVADNKPAAAQTFVDSSNSQYEPQLLDAARTRVDCIAAADHTVSEESAERDVEERSENSASLDANQEALTLHATDSDSPKQAAEKNQSRFRDLFTRLRKMQSRSA